MMGTVNELRFEASGVSHKEYELIAGDTRAVVDKLIIGRRKSSNKTTTTPSAPMH